MSLVQEYLSKSSLSLQHGPLGAAAKKFNILVPDGRDSNPGPLQPDDQRAVYHFALVQRCNGPLTPHIILLRIRRTGD